VKAVFLDTVGLLALWDKSDQWHVAAERAFAGLLTRRPPLVTTSFVLLECGNAAARRPYREAVARLRQRMEEGGQVIWPTTEDWEDGWRAYTQKKRSRASIVDHISFVVMRRLGLTEAFTNDQHFSTAGFEVLF
jgi:predicted nucleic acid-binding protein